MDSGFNMLGQFQEESHYQEIGYFKGMEQLPGEKLNELNRELRSYFRDEGKKNEGGG